MKPDQAGIGRLIGREQPYGVALAGATALGSNTEKEVAVSDNEYRIARIPDAEEDPDAGLSASATIGLMVVCSTEFGIPMNEDHAELMANMSIWRVKELAWDEVADKIEDEYTTLRGLADYLRKQNPYRYDKEALEDEVRRLNDAEVSAD